MFLHFVPSAYQIPVYVWNPYFLQTLQTFQNHGNQSLLSINHSSTNEVFPEESIKNASLSNKQKMTLISSKLQELHEKNSGNKKTHWTQSQDKLLQKLVQKQKTQWKEIPKFFEGRTLSMCYSRYRRILMNTKEAWKKQDDQLIVNLVNNMGQKWKQISLQIPKFTPKQIRQRYLNYLRPNIDKSQFSFEQDLRICQLVLQHGKHWRKFEQELPGRTEGAIKSRFYSKLKDIIEIA